MNKVVLLGRLVRNAEVRYTQVAEPLAVCNFTIAVDRPYSKNKREGEPTADFINCVCFGKRGEAIGQYFSRGNKIALAGRIQTDSYTDKEGKKRTATKVVVEDFEFVDSRGANAQSGNVPYIGNDKSNDNFLIDEDIEADLPF